MKIVNSNDIAAHDGILGMKWGIRRFQFPDNKWTEWGKIRYSKAKGFVKDATSKAFEFMKNYHKISDKKVNEINNKITNNGKNIVAKFLSDTIRKTSDRLSTRIAQEIEKMIFEKPKQRQKSTKKVVYIYRNRQNTDTGEEDNSYEFEL
jgi:hypothetical protein